MNSCKNWTDTVCYQFLVKNLTKIINEMCPEIKTFVWSIVNPKWRGSMLDPSIKVIPPGYDHHGISQSNQINPYMEINTWSRDSQNKSSDFWTVDVFAQIFPTYKELTYKNHSDISNQKGVNYSVFIDHFVSFMSVIEIFTF